jgi:hypothetical protein
MVTIPALMPDAVDDRIHPLLGSCVITRVLYHLSDQQALLPNVTREDRKWDDSAAGRRSEEHCRNRRLQQPTHHDITSMA